MLLSKKLLLSIKADYQKCFFSSSTAFQTMFLKNPLKDAIRFESQNQNWTYQELDTHSDAFAYGLIELGYKPGDRLGLWLEKAHTSEIIASQLGAIKAGVVLTPLCVEKSNDLEVLIKESGIRGLIFSPNSKLEENTYSNLLKQTIPELNDSFNNGSALKSSKFTKLEHLIHTGFYSIPGTLKYKQMLVYASKKFNTLALPTFNLKSNAYYVKGQSGKFEDLTVEALVSNNEKLRKDYKINEKDIIFICGEIRQPFQFSLGLINSLTYGNNIVLTGNQPLKSISHVIKYHGNSVVIADGETFETSESGFNQEETKKSL